MGIQINFIQFLVEFMFYQVETKSLQIEDGLISFHKLEESSSLEEDLYLKKNENDLNLKQMEAEIII